MRSFMRDERRDNGDPTAESDAGGLLLVDGISCLRIVREALTSKKK